MKQGRNLQELAIELDRQRSAKKDYIGDTRRCSVRPVMEKDITAGIMDHLMRGGDFTKYGMHAAVTRFSQDVGSYDRATELEAVGGEIIELKPEEWTTIAVAIPA